MCDTDFAVSRIQRLSTLHQHQIVLITPSAALSLVHLLFVLYSSMHMFVLYEPNDIYRREGGREVGGGGYYGLAHCTGSMVWLVGGEAGEK